MDTLPSCFPTSGDLFTYSYVKLYEYWNVISRVFSRTRILVITYKAIYPSFGLKKIYATSGRSCCVNA
ncbi:hypothetical protein P8452_32287 [Trifolium repens]|nr:hypothetical protein P8452_32287 [Trifolium repens]